ncbi:MAG: hypothetical protein MdMp024_1954 [Bacteroidales bacterium]
MENLSDWLYIVLLAVAGISGVLTSGKKKKQVAETSRKPETTVAIPDIPNPAPSYQPIIMSSQKKTSKKKPFSSISFMEEGKRSIVSPPFATQLGQTEDSVDESAFRLSSEPFRNIDELKKAIIYSEILYRKY